MQLLDKRSLRLMHLVTKIFNLKALMSLTMRKLKHKFSQLQKLDKTLRKKSKLKSLQKQLAQDSRIKLKLTRTNA